MALVNLSLSYSGYLLLVLALLVLLDSNRPISAKLHLAYISLATLAVGQLMAHSIIYWPAGLLVAVLLLATVIPRFIAQPPAWLRPLLQAVLGLCAVALTLALVPGVERAILTEPFAGLSINTGKLLAAILLGALLLVMGPCRFRAQQLQGALQVIASGCAAVLLAYSIYLWLNRGTTDISARILVLLGINLSVTCVAEELFFRRWLLCQQLRIQPTLAALATNSVVFGAVHLPHSVELAAMATIAGALYGAIFLLYRMVSLSILVHWLVNLPLLFFWLS